MLHSTATPHAQLGRRKRSSPPHSRDHSLSDPVNLGIHDSAIAIPVHDSLLLLLSLLGRSGADHGRDRDRDPGIKYKWRAKMIFVRPARKKWAGGVVPLPESLVDRVVPLSKTFLRAGGPHILPNEGAVRPWRRKSICDSPSALQGLAGCGLDSHPRHTQPSISSPFSLVVHSARPAPNGSRPHSRARLRRRVQKS